MLVQVEEPIEVNAGGTSCGVRQQVCATPASQGIRLCAPFFRELCRTEARVSCAAIDLLNGLLAATKVR